MTPTTVGILGLVCITAIMVTLSKSKTHPAIAFIVFPSLLAVLLVLGGYYTIPDIAKLIKAGFDSTSPTAALFVFSVLYFSTMNDTGMFDVIINKMMQYVGKSVIGVAVITAVIALIGHLDGGGASTFLIVIPAMLPIYKRMHMRTTTLLRISVLCMGVMNLLPWGGPTMRVASVLDMEASSLWNTILPIQNFGILLALGHAVLAGIQEKRRGAGLDGALAMAGGGAIDDSDDDNETVEKALKAKEKNKDLERPHLFLFNICLTVGVIALPIWDEFPSYVPFMLGLATALFVNYGASAKMHKRIINLHAASALMMCSTLMSAGVLMGILTKTVTIGGVKVASVVTCMSDLITLILPDMLGFHLPIIIGILSVPLALAFDTNSYFYGLLPVMIGIGESFGIEPLHLAIAMLVCRNCATFISPMVPSTLLGIGLANVDIKDLIKSTFGYAWVFSIICMLYAILIGIMPL